MTEMAEAGVTDFQRHFAHVELTRAQQCGRLVHAQLTQILRDGLAGVIRKNAAQIKMTATDPAAEVLERWRVGRILAQKEDDLLGAFLGQALLARTKKFLFRRRLDQEGDGEFQRLALIPER